LDQYRDRAKEIITFGIGHNKEIQKDLEGRDFYIDELGGIKSWKNDYYGLSIFVDVEVSDSEIKELVDHLSNFK
jgi:hypothetical protein